MFTKLLAYEIRSRFRAAQRGLIPGSFTALHIALHFIAVADVISAAVLYLQLRRADKARIASAVASTGTLPRHPTDVQ